MESADALNGVRNPSAWKRLQAARVSEEMKGTRESVIARACASAGFTVKWEGLDSFDHLRKRREFSTLAINEAASSSLEPDRWRSDEWTFIVDDREIRILPRRKALEFWKQWWADEQARRK